MPSYGLSYCFSTLEKRTQFQSNDIHVHLIHIFFAKGGFVIRCICDRIIMVILRSTNPHTNLLGHRAVRELICSGVLICYIKRTGV